MFIAPTLYKMVQLRRSDMSQFKNPSRERHCAPAELWKYFDARVYKHLVPNGTRRRALQIRAMPLPLPILRRLFRVFELFLPPPVTTLLDQLSRPRRDLPAHSSMDTASR